MHKMIVETTNLETMREKSSVNKNNNNYKKVLDINNKLMNKIEQLEETNKVLMNKIDKLEERMIEMIEMNENRLDRLEKIMVEKNESFIDKLEETMIEMNENNFSKIEKLFESFGKKNTKIISDKPTTNLKELKREKIFMEESKVLKALEFRDYNSVIYIFKNIYKNNTEGEYSYPIRVNSKNKIEYYDNKTWNADIGGVYSKKTIINNIHDLFCQYCSYEVSNDDEVNEKFILNQEFITKLSDNKYQKQLFENLLNEIKK
jgi:hypothetical protein